MITLFNGYIFFGIFIVTLLMGAYYAYRSLLDTKSFMNQYGIHVTALLPARLAGSLIASITKISASALEISFSSSISAGSKAIGGNSILF